MVAAVLAALALVQVTAPQPGDPFVSPLRVTGAATVPFTLEVTNWDGLIVARRSVTRTGPFAVDVRFATTVYARGSLIVRPRGGRVVEIPLGTKVVTIDGVVGVRPGMSPTAVAHAWGVTLRLSGPSGLDCTTAPVTVAGMSGTALFQQNRFSAVFLDRKAATDTGIRIGSTLADLRRVYGKRLESRPDKYEPGARNFFLTERWQLRFDVSKRGRVTTIGFGDAGVRLVEGCS